MDSSFSNLSPDFRYFSPSSSVVCLKDSTKLIRIVDYLGPVYLKLNVDMEGYCPVRNCVAERHGSVLASYCWLKGMEGAAGNSFAGSHLAGLYVKEYDCRGKVTSASCTEASTDKFCLLHFPPQDSVICGFIKIHCGSTSVIFGWPWYSDFWEKESVFSSWL